MSTTPPSSTPPPDDQGMGARPSMNFGARGDLARLPIPGNAELVVWLLVLVLFAIITLSTDSVDAPLFVTATAAITFGYLVSRGIAKASRVLEQ